MKLEKYKIVDLKLELKKRGLSQNGKKCELINRLKKAINSSFLDESNVNTEIVDTPAVNDLKSPKKGPRNQKIFFNLINKIRELENSVKFLKVTLTKYRKKLLQNAVKPQTCGENLLNESSKGGLKPPKGNVVAVADPPVPKSDIKTSETSESKKHRIMVVGDANVIDFSNILRELVGNEFLITTFAKPNAMLDQITTTISSSTVNFDQFDYVIIFGGTADALRGHGPNFVLLDGCLSALSNTNVVLLGVPYCKTRKSLNNAIFELNCTLFKNTRKYDHVKYLDTNANFLNNSVNNVSPYIKYFAKKSICKEISQQYINNPFINNSNLIAIPMVSSAMAISSKNSCSMQVPNMHENSIISVSDDLDLSEASSGSRTSGVSQRSNSVTTNNLPLMHEKSQSNAKEDEVLNIFFRTSRVC